MTPISKIEALLFVAGTEGLELEALAALTGLTTAQTYEQLLQLKTHYETNPDAALTILEVGNQFLLTTKKEVAPLLKKYAQSPMAATLSQAALETLAIVAYKQPISRLEVDEIRGVQSSAAIQKLIARQLVEEKGRLDGPGRAILYGTTPYFMDYFGLKSIEELPDIQEMEDQIEAELPMDLFFDRYAKTEELLVAETSEATEGAN